MVLPRDVRFRGLVLIASVGMLLSSCSPNTAGSVFSTTTAILPATSTTFAPGIPDAGVYLNEAIEFVEANALFAGDIDWVQRRHIARDVASAASHPFHLHEFIRLMLADLNDNHSHFIGPDAATERNNESPPTNVSVELVDGRVGQVSVGAFSGSTDQSEMYVAELHTGIASLSQTGVCGWIVDLRTNTGGNMWPMIAGMGPLLEPIDRLPGDTLPGTLGYFVNAEGATDAWRYVEGSAFLADKEMLKVENPTVVKVPGLPIAIVVSRNTASAGEHVLMSFLDRPNTRTFGFPTFGATSANDNVTLSDGAGMLVAVASAANRNGETYDPLVPIHPDELGGGLQPAVEWLLSQSTCRQ